MSDDLDIERGEPLLHVDVSTVPEVSVNESEEDAYEMSTTLCVILPAFTASGRTSRSATTHSML